MNKLKIVSLPFASLLLCAILYLIWPTIHTMALRKLLLVLTAAIGVVLWIRSDDRYAIIKSPWLIWMALLLVWVMFHAAFISQNGNEAWSEFVGQWVTVYVAIVAGVGLALAGRSLRNEIFGRYLLYVVLAQPVLFVILKLFQSIHLGYLANEFEVGVMQTDLKTSLTFSSDMLAALACAKIYEGFRIGNSLKQNFHWVLLIILGLLAAIFTSALNSILLIAGCVLLLLIITFVNSKQYVRKLGFAVYCGFILLLLVGTFSQTLGHKLKSSFSNVKVSVNTTDYSHWKNYAIYGAPQNEFGEEIPGSFYLRVAFAHACLNASFDYPLGYGITRKACENIVKESDPSVDIANAHNSYIDMACAVGYPGLVLFVIAIVAIFRQLNKSNSDMAHPAIWMIGIYVAHWAVDALSRDHFFESFMFVVAVLLTITMRMPSSKTTHG